jgi:uncharacterized alkaline shock family protein YloU
MPLVIDGPHGTITVPDSVLLQIASRAAEGVDGVRVRRRGRSVDAEARAVRLEVAASRGEPLVAQGERVQEAVAAALKQTCDLDVTVDVVFEELVSEGSR